MSENLKMKSQPICTLGKNMRPCGCVVVLSRYVYRYIEIHTYLREVSIFSPKANLYVTNVYEKSQSAKLINDS